MSFPYTPYPITGKLYIIGNIAQGKKITGINTTVGDTEEITTENDGSFIIDPANMKDTANMKHGYSNNDSIKITFGAWYKYINIDLTNYPDGIQKDLSIPPIITILKGRGIGLPQGISCGKSKR